MERIRTELTMAGAKLGGIFWASGSGTIPSSLMQWFRRTFSRYTAAERWKRTEKPGTNRKLQMDTFGTKIIGATIEYFLFGKNVIFA